MLGDSIDGDLLDMGLCLNGLFYMFNEVGEYSLLFVCGGILVSIEGLSSLAFELVIETLCAGKLPKLGALKILS